MKKKIFWENFFSGIPDPDFDPDSTFSGFLEFFESLAYIKHLCRRIFELYQIVALWTGRYFITSPLCRGGSWYRKVRISQNHYNFEVCSLGILLFWNNERAYKYILKLSFDHKWIPPWRSGPISITTQYALRKKVWPRKFLTLRYSDDKIGFRPFKKMRLCFMLFLHMSKRIRALAYRGEGGCFCIVLIFLLLPKVTRLSSKKCVKLSSMSYVYIGNVTQIFNLLWSQ